MKAMEKISDTLFKVEKILSILLMSVMLSSIALGVIFRYFFGDPLTWSDELAVYMLVWLTFIGGSMSVKTLRAANLDLLFERVSLLWKRIFLIVGYATVVIFGIVLTYMAIKWISNPSVKTQLSPGLKISMFLPYLAVPFGAVCLTIHSLNLLIKGFIYSENDATIDGGDE